MVDIAKEKNTTPTPEAPVQVASLTAPQPAAAKPHHDQKEVIIFDKDDYLKNRKKTTGEKIFNRTVYTGIGFGVNEGISLYISDEFRHGTGESFINKLGFKKQNYDAIADWASKYFSPKTVTYRNGITEKLTPRDRAGNSLLFISLLIGGTLLVWPMRALEDHKNFWVKKINHGLDAIRSKKLTKEEIEARDAEVEQAVACAPQQSWPSLLIGRAIAVMTTVAFGTFVMDKPNTTKAETGAQRFLNWVTGDRYRSKKGGVPDEKLPEQELSRTQRYFRLAGPETISCAISSLVMEIASKFAANGSKHVNEPDKCPGVIDVIVPADSTSVPKSTPRPSDAQAILSSALKARKAAPTASATYAGMVANQRQQTEEAKPQLSSS
jgi:hypothetical protein